MNGMHEDTGVGADELLAALAVERRLLDEVCDALAAQRSGIADDDSAGIEGANHRLARAMLTLDEARRRREQLAQLAALTPLPTAPLHDRYGTPIDALTAARDSLREAARSTVQALALNQTILRRAMRAGDRYLQQLFASAAEPLPTYTAPSDVRPAQRGLVVNRSA